MILVGKLCNGGKKRRTIYDTAMYVYHQRATFSMGRNEGFVMVMFATVFRI